MDWDIADLGDIDSHLEADYEDRTYAPEEDAEPTPEEVAFNRYWDGPLPGMIEAATKRHHWVWLGCDDEEAGNTPLEQLKADLQRAIKDVDAMLDHEHKWNGDDYCDVCGLDGRA